LQFQKKRVHNTVVDFAWIGLTCENYQNTTCRYVDDKHFESRLSLLWDIFRVGIVRQKDMMNESGQSDLELPSELTKEEVCVGFRRLLYVAE